MATKCGECGKARYLYDVDGLMSDMVTRCCVECVGAVIARFVRRGSDTVTVSAT